MSDIPNSQKYTYLNHLSTMELEEILRADIDAPSGSDIDMVLYIMEVIAQREGQTESLEVQASAQKARQEFETLYNIPEGEGLSLYPSDDAPKTTMKLESELATTKTTHPNNHRTIRRLLVIAAIIACLSTMLAPTALGYRSFFEMIGQWSSDVFGFTSVDTETQLDTELTKEPTSDEESEGNYSLDSASYEDFKDALEDNDISGRIVPPMLPDGFGEGLLNVAISNDDHSLRIFGIYYNENKYISLNVIERLSLDSGYYEKTNVEVIEYSHDGVVYYIMVPLSRPLPQNLS
ncbi:hypothetical protein RFF05_13860 [Bengtsoniella intestinalis]|uniref:hypothetical protein n=1 Tax=Bengtsoniella intestinalis TaxID=3073143 RepID=UPI00391F873B